MYAAKIESGLVTQVIVGSAAWARESIGGVWEPSENKIGINWTFTVAEGFRPPQPFSSWVWFDGKWSAPLPYPDDGGVYDWDEDSLSWVEIELEEGS